MEKHCILVEIDWSTGTEGYAFERYRAPAFDYQDLLVGIGRLGRSASPLGGMDFPNTSIQLVNRDLYFTNKLYATPHRGVASRIRIIPADGTYSNVITVFTGTISRMTSSSGVISFELVSHNFEQIFASTMADRLPVLSRGNFPNLPISQVPTVVPLVYGRVNSPWGEDLADPQTAGIIPAYLVDTAGSNDLTWVASNSPADKQWQDVCWSPELGIAVAVAGGIGDGTTRVMTSPDGTTWTTHTCPDELWRKVVWAPELGLFVAVSDSISGGNGVMTSTNGTSWVSRGAAAAGSWIGITWAPELSLFVAVSSAGTYRVMTSPDGIIWTGRTAANTNAWSAVTWSPQLKMFAAVSFTGTGDRIMTSLDGITWAVRKSPADNEWAEVIWVEGLEVFVALANTGSQDRAMASEDGITWLLSPLAPAHNWLRLAWSPDFEMLAGVAYSGSVEDLVTSVDAVTWTSQTTPAITFGNGYHGIVWAPELRKFIVVGKGTTNAVLNSPAGLGTQFKYAIGTGVLAGDIGDPGYLHFVTRYGRRKSARKQITQITAGGQTISLIAFAADQRDPQRPSEPEITYYGSGICSGAPGSDPILNPVLVKQHFMENYAGFNSSDLDTVSFTAAKTQADGQRISDDETAGVAPASVGVIVHEMSETVASVIEALDTSFGMMSFQARNGTIGTLIHDLGSLPDAVVALDDENDILKDSMTLADRQEIATALQLKIGYRATSNQYGDPQPGNQYAQWVPVYEIPCARRSMFPNHATASIMKPIEMPYCRRVGTAIQVARALAEYLHPKAFYVSLSVPISYFDQIDVGDYIEVTHWQGINTYGIEGGFQNDKMRVMALELVDLPTQPAVQLELFMRAPGVVAYDNFERNLLAPGEILSIGDTDHPWVESDEDFLNRALIIDGAFTEPSVPQSSVLLAGSYTGIAKWNLSTDKDQIASIQILRRDAGSSGKIGVFVRGSGSYSNFTGYLATLEEEAVDSVYVRLYRTVNKDLRSDLGVLLGEKKLTAPAFEVSTWESQGDTLEVRVEGSVVELWYFSDVAENSLGRVLQVTDTTITANGQMGIASLEGNGTWLSSFYGRSYVPSS